eukprot:m.837579 g.837579  ORF g.837579 m.837579 type:complete len:1010 (+) comp59489_c0_seq1:48-3077(+)
MRWVRGAAATGAGCLLLVLAFNILSETPPSPAVTSHHELEAAIRAAEQAQATQPPSDVQQAQLTILRSKLASELKRMRENQEKLSKARHERANLEMARSISLEEEADAAPRPKRHGVAERLRKEADRLEAQLKEPSKNGAAKRPEKARGAKQTPFLTNEAARQHLEAAIALRQREEDIRILEQHYEEVEAAEIPEDPVAQNDEPEQPQADDKNRPAAEPVEYELQPEPEIVAEPESEPRPALAEGKIRPVRFPDEGDVDVDDPGNLMQPLPPRNPNETPRIALICLWLGKLPVYIDYFLKSAAANKHLGIDFYIFYTAESPAPVVTSANIFLERLTLEQVAFSIADALAYADGQKAEGNGAHAIPALEGAKGNDLKALYGAIFRERLSKYSHWGWMDLDCLFGDLTPMTEHARHYDVVTYPDGELDAVYFAGQLTVFRNIEYFRKFFTARYSWEGKATIHLAYLFQEAGNRLWDEMYSIFFALRHPQVTLYCDFTQQIMAPFSNANAFIFDQNVLYMFEDEVVPRKLLSQPEYDERLPSMAAGHSCVPWYKPDWTWLCLPTARNTAVAWENGAFRVVVTPFQTFSDGSRIGLFMHLHKWKEGSTYTVEPTGLQSSRFICAKVISSQGQMSIFFGSFEAMPESLKRRLQMNRGKVPGPLSSSDLHSIPAFKYSPVTGGSLLSRAAKQAPTTLNPRTPAPRPQSRAPAPEAAKGQHVIPKIVHFIITDGGQSFFDWTRYSVVLAASIQLKPDVMYLHLIDGVRPYGLWFDEAAKLCTIRNFTRADVPTELNGHKVTHVAHVSDFYRMNILYHEGGIYLDLDAMVLRSFEPLTSGAYSLVLGWEEGDQVGIGVVVCEKKAPMIEFFRQRMRELFNGNWITHSVEMLTVHFKSTKTDTDILLLPKDGFYPFSWYRPDLQSLIDGHDFDWSKSYAMHYFHSQSYGMLRYYDGTVQQGRGNLAVALELALGPEGLSKLKTLWQNGPQFSPDLEKHVRQHLAQQGVVPPSDWKLVG